MQTFVPYTSFTKCAAVLDTKRLGKQIIEAQQIFKALTQPDYGWQNHPAVRMWAGSESALVQYARACNVEWRMRRGKDHGAYLNLVDIVKRTPLKVTSSRNPVWWGDDRVHESHRSNLLRKDPDHYGTAFAGVPDNLPYVWPTKETV